MNRKNIRCGNFHLIYERLQFYAGTAYRLESGDIIYLPEE